MSAKLSKCKSFFKYVAILNISSGHRKPHCFFTTRYCDAQGLPQPRGPCDAGFVCIKGAFTKTPTDKVTGSPCPAGGYCRPGSFVSQPCPPGTYSNTSGAINVQDCRTCDPGYFCEKASGPSPEGPCYAGYYCSKGAISPMENITDAGFYAPAGSSSQRPCQVGTYQPYKGKGQCDPCTAGYYCDTTEMTNLKNCTPGHYCPEGINVPQPCPAGTYNNFFTMSKLSDCLDCPPGKYCGTAAIVPAGTFLLHFFSFFFSLQLLLQFLSVVLLCLNQLETRHDFVG